MGQLRYFVGALLIWGAVAVVIIALFDTPAWSARTFELVSTDTWRTTGVISSTVVMLTLMALYIGMMVRTWLTLAALPFVRLVLGGAIAVIIYSFNVLLKGNYQQLRPCHELAVATECPPIDSFSYPSNHTVIAFGLAAGLVFALPRAAYFALPLAVIEGISRVLAGHHYPHDILAGAALGMLGVLGALMISQPLQLSFSQHLAEARAARRISPAK